jgi:hypothetical protein
LGKEHFMENGLVIDLGMLCRFCDRNTYELPDVEGVTADQRELIEGVCKMCLENGRTAVNS